MEIHFVLMHRLHTSGVSSPIRRCAAEIFFTRKPSTCSRQCAGFGKDVIHMIQEQFVLSQSPRPSSWNWQTVLCNLLPPSWHVPLRIWASVFLNFQNFLGRVYRLHSDCILHVGYIDLFFLTFSFRFSALA